MIVSTIGCLIMDAIFPPHRHGKTERGTAMTKRKTSRKNGAGNGKENTELRYRYTVSVEMF